MSCKTDVDEKKLSGRAVGCRKSKDLRAVENHGVNNSVRKVTAEERRCGARDTEITRVLLKTPMAGQEN